MDRGGDGANSLLVIGQRRVNTPWAILLCKFTGEDSEPYPRQRFEEIFTTAGNGQFNMIDYFDSISHGRLDLNGSRIFPSAGKGWYRLPQRRSDYLGFDTKPGGRGALLTWARKAAADSGDNLSAFTNIVVVNSVSTDLYGGLDGVATDDGRDSVNGATSLSASVLGQEMSHGYGLEHARIEGSTADYMDPFDVMSTKSAFMAPHPVYNELDAQGRPVFLIGPGLNAASMSSRGWLDSTRVWTAGSSLQSSVTLRPLHRRDLPGFLCARVDDYFVEFRMNDLWDGGFSAPVVLVHDFFDGHSYLHRTPTGSSSMGAGDSFADGDVSNNPSPVHQGGVQVTVTSIDAAAQTATIQVQRWTDTRPDRVGQGTVFGGVDVDGGGWFFVNGRLVKVPPRSPVLEVLNHLEQVRISESIRDGFARGLVRQSAFEAIAGLAQSQAEHALSLHSPAAGMTDPEAQS